eukprot:349898-Chlamydomonas_euryale.AAC.10
MVLAWANPAPASGWQRRLRVSHCSCPQQAEPLSPEAMCATAWPGAVQPTRCAHAPHACARTGPYSARDASTARWRAHGHEEAHAHAAPLGLLAHHAHKLRLVRSAAGPQPWQGGASTCGRARGLLRTASYPCGGSGERAGYAARGPGGGGAIRTK